MKLTMEITTKYMYTRAQEYNSLCMERIESAVSCKISPITRISVQTCTNLSNKFESKWRCNASIGAQSLEPFLRIVFVAS